MIRTFIRRDSMLAIIFLSLAFSPSAHAEYDRAPLDAMIARHAALNEVPEALVRRVIVRESRYNARAVNAGNYGLMQIRLGTARAMGYRGGADGLLDAETNLTYAVKYLAGALRAAGGNHDRAVAYYASGYYAQAKRAGVDPYAAPASAAR